MKTSDDIKISQDEINGNEKNEINVTGVKKIEILKENYDFIEIPLISKLLQIHNSHVNNKFNK